MKLEYKSTLSLKAIPAFSKKILTKLEPYCKDQDFWFDVRLALEEALVNAVKHGNKADSHKSVRVSIELNDKAVTIEVKDEGAGFDYERLARPTDQKNLEKLSGRGVFLMKNLMDSVTYLDKGSRVRMIKHLKSNNP